MGVRDKSTILVFFILFFHGNLLLFFYEVKKIVNSFACLKLKVSVFTFEREILEILRIGGVEIKSVIISLIKIDGAEKKGLFIFSCQNMEDIFLYFFELAVKLFGSLVLIRKRSERFFQCWVLRSWKGKKWVITYCLHNFLRFRILNFLSVNYFLKLFGYFSTL